jgi:hypothetical protein
MQSQRRPLVQRCPVVQSEEQKWDGCTQRRARTARRPTPDGLSATLAGDRAWGLGVALRLDSASGLPTASSSAPRCTMGGHCTISEGRRQTLVLGMGRWRGCAAPASRGGPSGERPAKGEWLRLRRGVSRHLPQRCLDLVEQIPNGEGLGKEAGGPHGDESLSLLLRIRHVG